MSRLVYRDLRSVTGQAARPGLQPVGGGLCSSIHGRARTRIRVLGQAGTSPLSASMSTAARTTGCVRRDDLRRAAATRGPPSTATAAPIHRVPSLHRRGSSAGPASGPIEASGRPATFRFPLLRRRPVSASPSSAEHWLLVHRPSPALRPDRGFGTELRHSRPATTTRTARPNAVYRPSTGRISCPDSTDRSVLTWASRRHFRRGRGPF